MRQDQWLNTLTIAGKNYGVWDTLAGGDIAFSENKYKKGGMKPEKTLGGTKTVNNVTLGRLLDIEDADDWDLLKGLMVLEENTPATISRQPLDADGNPFGKPLGYTGLVLQAMPGDTDANQEGPQVWSVVISTDGTVS